MRKLRLPFSCSYFAGCEYYTISLSRVEHAEHVEWGVALTRDHEKTRKLLACLWQNRKTIGRHWMTRGKNTKAIGLPLVVPEALGCSWVFVCRNVPNLRGCSWVFVCREAAFRVRRCAEPARARRGWRGGRDAVSSPDAAATSRVTDRRHGTSTAFVVARQRPHPTPLR